MTEETCRQYCRFIIATDATIRQTADEFKVSKSQVGLAVKQIVWYDRNLADKIRSIMETHIIEGRSKGGKNSTRKHQYLIASHSH